MKKTRKKYLMIIFLSLSMTVLPIGGVKAALQSNPNTYGTKKDNTTNWMSNIRKMEEANGSMGLSESLNSDLTSKESNNIDVHMMRNTEYGAIAILSASGYGNSQTFQNSTIKSTTGNKTGVYFNNTEWAAGGLSGSIFSGANAKYYDTYTHSSTSARVGDALECTKWHSGSYASWLGSGAPCFKRVSGGGLFSFDYGGASVSYLGRGVAVVGAGL